ncbi:MAG: peptidoglycan DD-metalloendopeptidase family protein [Ruminococcus sp.]|nr:peptidoglycan DD-metalloendopeptidase family protein [Ruminococcus sp.]
MKHTRLSMIRRSIALLTGAALSVAILTAPSDRYEKPVHAKTIAELQEEINENKEKIKEKQAELEELKSDIAKHERYQLELQEAIDLQNKQILLVDTQLATINQNIAQKETDIALLEEDIDKQELDIEDGLEQFKHRIRAMYITGNDSLTSALVGSTDFYDVLAKMDLIARISQHDDELIQGLMEQLTVLEESKTKLTAELAELDIARKEQESKKEEYTAAISELNQKMKETDAVKAEIAKEEAALEADIQAFKDEIDSKSAEQDAIAAEIKRQQELAQQQQQQNGGNSGGNSGGNDTVAPFTGQLAWPVPGFYWISSYYGYRWGKLHAGIDIAGGGISGATVVASEAGTVTLVRGGCTHNYKKSSSCGCNGGYGNYVVVDHGNGLSTLYAHLATINVSYQQQVSKGTSLGTVGSTGWSTGFHLHYAVIQNGAYVNPAPYLGV